DATSSICVWQSGENVRTPTTADVRRVRIEYSVVVCLPIFSKRFDYVRIWFVTVGLQRTEYHSETRVRHDCAFEWSVSLQSDNEFIISIDVTRFMSSDA